jgi:drug/metabolite transporter (DMT)-like permease
MIDLVLGIFFFNIILVLFKLFDRYKVDNLQAIVVNYIVAAFLGLVTSGIENPIDYIISSEWVFYAVSIGVFFVIVFNFLATAAQKVGIAISTVANKMSVIIPVIFAFIVFKDSISALKITGILLALIGVYLTSTSGKKLAFDKKYLWIIIIIFIGQGIADCIFNYAQHYHVDENDAKIFISSMFVAASLTGLAMLIPKYIKRQSRFEVKNIGWGIALGVPNFLTVFYFFRSLESGFMEASQVYPILNMGVIVLSAITAFLLFKEKLSLSNWLGIGISIIAIVAITFG